MSDCLEFFEAMFILLLIFMGLACVFTIVYPSEVVMVNGTVVGKEIVHQHKFLDNDPDYYVYTEDYCFNVDLHDYNNLNVGDIVSIERESNGTMMVTLVLDDSRYYNV